MMMTTSAVSEVPDIPATPAEVLEEDAPAEAVLRAVGDADI